MQARLRHSNPNSPKILPPNDDLRDSVMPTIPKATVPLGYRSQSIDTTLDADVLMFSLLRQLTPEHKAQRVIALDRTLRQLSSLKSMIEDPVQLARAVADILERLDIPYYIGGSLASSLLGESRYSEDLDLIITMTSHQEATLLQALAERFYVSETVIHEALQGRSLSFNIISLNSGEKIDLFISQVDDFAVSKMTRRFRYSMPDGAQLWLCTAEDMILQKLVGFQMSANESQKQWRDVLGMLKLQGEKLDFTYLRTWAKALGLASELSTALDEAGLSVL